MTTTETPAIRELTETELTDASGGTISIFGYTIHFVGGGGGLALCVDNGERYRCLTTANGKWYSNSGNVPK